MNMNLPYAFSQGILNQGLPQQQLPYNLGQPVLTNPNQPQAPNPPALSMSPYGNARGSSRTPQIPSQQINMGGEGLMRIGAAGLGAGAQGPLAQMGAMGNMYGGLMDYNRQREMEAFNVEEGRRVEEQRRADIMRRLNARNGAAADKKDKDAPDHTREITNLTSSLEALKRGGLTGWIDGKARAALDRAGISIAGFGGDTTKAAERLILEELSVFATLEFTAKTKGAITDREMALFQRPVPQITDDEDVWINWIEPRLEILNQVHQNGVSNERAAQDGGTSGSGDDGGFKILSVED